MLKTMREFELEQEIQDLKRELAQVRGMPLPAIMREEPAVIRSGFADTMQYSLRRVGMVACSWDYVQQPDHKRHVVLECAEPPLDHDQAKGEPLQLYRAAYFIDDRVAFKKDQVAGVVVDMHERMLMQLYRRYLKQAA